VIVKAKMFCHEEHEGMNKGFNFVPFVLSVVNSCGVSA